MKWNIDPTHSQAEFSVRGSGATSPGSGSSGYGY